MGLISRSWSKGTVLTALTLAMVVLMADMGTNVATATAVDCKQMRRLGINACKPLLWGQDPSAECCYRIRITPEYCVCPVVTPKLAALVTDLGKAIRIIESCGRRVPRHHKCGSKAS
ncbi:hypothetical protein QQ045_020512 [Rhodiola kirilowii]